MPFGVRCGVLRTAKSYCCARYQQRQRQQLSSPGRVEGLRVAVPRLFGSDSRATAPMAMHSNDDDHRTKHADGKLGRMSKSERIGRQECA